MSKGDEIETKSIYNTIKRIDDSEVSDMTTELKKLYVPEYLLCLISRELMIDPVTIQSGITYERASIEQFFIVRRELAARAIRDADSDIEEERNLTEADYMNCPVTMQKVDPEVMIANKALKAATEKFLDEHPWAFQFNPREKIEDIRF